MGYESEFRPVSLGETLSQFDRVIVFLASMRGFTAIHSLQALWAIYAAGEKCVISFDDWQIPQALGGIVNLRRDWDSILAKNPFGYREHDRHTAYVGGMLAALDQLVSPAWPWPVVVPAYHGGDLRLLGIPECRLSSYNPAVYFKARYGWENGVSHSRAKTWVLAALHNHGSWLKKQGSLAWPVQQFGHKSQGQPRLPEREIYAKYAASRGVLSPPYKTCGSGWWRARYGFAADALCVVAGSGAEVAMLDSDVYALSPIDVETLSDEDFWALAILQREAYYKAAGTLEALRARLADVFQLV